jgi:hypothetical protein
MPATLIIEDGTASSPSANSYITLDEVDTLCDNYGLSSWASLATDDKTTAVFRGMAYVETFDFKGEKYSYDDPLEWPRVGVYDDINLEPEYEEFYQEIPNGLKNAVCRAAYEESVTPGVLQPTLTAGIKREKIDVIEVEYVDAKPSTAIYPTIKGFIKGLIANANMVTVKRT